MFWSPTVMIAYLVIKAIINVILEWSRNYLYYCLDFPDLWKSFSEQQWIKRLSHKSWHTFKRLFADVLNRSASLSDVIQYTVDVKMHATFNWERRSSIPNLLSTLTEKFNFIIGIYVILSDMGITILSITQVMNASLSIDLSSKNDVSSIPLSVFVFRLHLSVSMLVSVINMACSVIYSGFWPHVLPSSEWPLFTDCGWELVIDCPADISLLHSPGRIGFTRTYELYDLQTSRNGLIGRAKAD